MIAPLSVLGSGYVANAPDGPKLDLSLLERTLRRGLSDTTRLFMHCAKLALDDAAIAPDRVHVLFASAFGEIATAEALLLEAYDANGSSPARFRNSVHNTTTGLLSISTKNRLPSSAIAAGWDTAAMALCEASAQLESGAEHVLLVFAEEPVPAAISTEHTYGALGAAFVLARDGAARSKARITRLAASSCTPLAPFEPCHHPLAPALELARAIEQRRAGELLASLRTPQLALTLETTT
jgi:hypothetical protein